MLGCGVLVKDMTLISVNYDVFLNSLCSFYLHRVALMIQRVEFLKQTLVVVVVISFFFLFRTGREQIVSSHSFQFYQNFPFKSIKV